MPSLRRGVTRATLGVCVLRVQYFTSNSSVYDQGGARPDTCKASENKLKHRQAVCGGLVVPPAASITRYLPQRKQNEYI